MLASAYLLVLAIIALFVPLALALRDRVDGEVRSQAASQAAALAVPAADLLAPASRPALQAVVRQAGGRTRGRLIVVDAGGRLLADSGGAAPGARYGTRPEVRAALAGRAWQRSRHSQTLHTNLLVTAMPIVHAGHVVGAVRITQSVAAVHRAVRRTILELGLIAGLVLVVGLAVAVLLARGLAMPLLRLERTAGVIAGGDLDARAEERGALEQRSLARSFNTMTDRLTTLLAAQRRFASDASHGLRTPLTALRLRLERLATTWPAPAPRTDLDAALAEVDRLGAIVEDLLTLSRAGERPPGGGSCDLVAAVEAAADRFAAAADAVGVTMSVHAAPEASYGCCTPGDLDRALDVLIENALAYGATGGVVELRVAPGVVEVADRGPGPASGEEEVLFDRFHRGSAARGGAPGTGLGLSIARALARGWGGEAILTARTGGGAVAVLVIPAEVASPTTTPIGAPAR